MEIAIIGAGVSGLSCAIKLKQHGIQADVFEKRAIAGDRFVTAEVFLNLLDYPFYDSIRYLSEEHDLLIKPTSNIKKMFIHGPNVSSCLEGHLGYSNLRGKHDEALEKQLQSQYEGNIYFENKVDYQEIAKEYSHIVLATGDPLDTQQIQMFEEAFRASFKGGIVTGEFTPNEVHAWFNNELAPKGMCYLIPHSHSEASLVLVYPQYKENQHVDKEALFQKFHEEAQRKLNQTLNLVSHFSINDYRIGISSYPRIGNTYFAGNCFGAITPFLGFGQFTSILTGIYSAMDIMGKGNYDELTKPLYQNFYDSLALRRGIEKLDNSKLDLVMKSIHTKILETMLTRRKVNLLKIASKALKPFL
ncbi:flavin-dependent dehydrogenase [Melghiribacillus thermohalophilus]|uniref:Flavin-dependent dehydrogenase n=1 Tax=Melghiribacillus thermohalophilus TaxID=1324956 RepID=A0A4R3NDJ1_9BACI|nr:NAD(P)/FAD-dependent oxidoreductase [Melghiribacillus thermohalophilus]TCT27063.1 flavin-dependent dehydrogenase [Melghiribacillus thermohalophilus]